MAHRVNLIAKQLSMESRTLGSLSLESRAVVYTKNGPITKVTKVLNYKLGPITPHSVLVKILAAPINPADVNIIEGSYPVKAKFESFGAIGGNEGVAEVIQIGHEVNGLSVGDWVIPDGNNMNNTFNTWQTFALVDAAGLMKLPDKSVSKILAATIAVNPPTAYRMLKDFGNLKPGDVVIQNSANSAVGQSVIQLAKAWNYKTVNIIRNRPNVEKLKEFLYSLGADLVIIEDDVRKPDTIAKIKALGGKAKLGLNGVGGKSATNLARLLDDEAWLVTYGGMSKEPVVIPTSLYIFKRLTCTGFWMNKWQISRPSSAKLEIYKELLELAKQGKLKEPLHQTFSLNSDSAETLVKAVDESFTANGKSIFVQ